MGNLNQFFRDLGRNAYGLGENVASLGSAAIAEPVAGFAAMYDPANGAQAIREGMTYQPRTQAGQMYQQGAARTLGALTQPVMPIVDTWQRGVDIAGGYSPVAGAALRTVPTSLGALMGAKPALQAGRQASNTLGSLQGRIVANANMPNTLNRGFMGQRGAIGTLSTDDDLRALAKFNQMDDVYRFDNSHEYYDPIDKLVARNLSDDAFDFMELPTSYGKMSITPSAKEQGKWQVTQWSKDGYPLSDSGNQTKEKALRIFFEDSRPELLAAPKRPLTEFEQAHQLAQRNAALPVSQGGLGLAADNTAMDRARAIGTEIPKIKQISDNWESQGVRNSVSENKNRVMLSQVVVPKELRNQGIGSKYMQDLIDYADSVGKRVELSPSADFGGNKNKLKEFYSRFGFIENKGRNKDFEISETMYRQPKQKPQRPLTEFEQAHLLAQRNAALPVNQGGLGLAPDNTAMDRARAMGFKGEGVHYTPNDFDAFREGKGDYSAVWVTTDPKVNLAAHNIGHNGEMIEGTNGMPLLFNNQKRVTATDKWDNDITSNFPDNVSELDAQKLKALGFTHGAMGTQAAILDPKNIRSRFAAFDPFNRDSANLLAQYGGIAPAATLGALMANEKRKDKRN